MPISNYTSEEIDGQFRRRVYARGREWRGGDVPRARRLHICIQSCSKDKLVVLSLGREKEVARGECTRVYFFELILTYFMECVFIILDASPLAPKCDELGHRTPHRGVNANFF